MKWFIKYLAFFLMCFATVNSYAQTDTEFWFGSPDITVGHDDDPIKLNLTSCGAPTKVTISFPANPAITPYEVLLAADEYRVLDLIAIFGKANIESGFGISNKGIHIESENDITAYYEIDGNWNRDIFSLKGSNGIGTSFVIPGNNEYNNPDTYWPRPYSGFCVVATEDGTTISITPTAEVKGGHLAGVTYTVSLDEGQIYTAEAQSRFKQFHLGGSLVISDKPITITIYDDSMASNIGGCRDMLGDQIVPTNIVGKEYIVMRGFLGSYDLQPLAENTITDEFIFITPIENTTTVTVTDGDGDHIYNLDISDNQSYPIKYSTTLISANKPIYVLHVTGFGCEMGGAILPTIDGCTGSSFVSFTRTHPTDPFFLNIMVRGVNNGHKSFIIEYADGTFFAIPQNYFEPIIGTDWFVLKKDKKQFANSKAGGIPIGQRVNIKNSADVFHLGIINGNKGNGCKYGYFSDFKPTNVQGDVAIKDFGNDMYMCDMDPITLIVSGGRSYQWTATDPAHLAYLSATDIRNPIANLPFEGSYYYHCLVKRNCLADTTVHLTINVLQQSYAKFDVNTNVVCHDNEITFTNKSLYSTQNRWDFKDDGNLIIDNNATVNYNYLNSTITPIQYTVTLTTISAKGCPDSYTQQVLVYPIITADFDQDITEGCNPVEVNFTDNSSGDTDPDKYSWIFGDGSFSFDLNPTHTYSNLSKNDSTFNVKLIVESPYKCLDSLEKTVKVFSYIDANFTTDNLIGCSPFILNINNTSSGDINSLEWDFDDGSPISNTTSSTFSHSYSNVTATPLLFNLQVTAENSSGCTDVNTKQITVYPEVIADFSVDNTQICDSTIINFTNNSSGFDMSYEWNFGDGGSSSLTTPVHLYNNKDIVNSAIYSASLLARSIISGCTDSKAVNIEVYPYVSADFTIEKTGNCTPFSAILKNGTIGGNLFTWEFDDGTPNYNSTIADDVTHLFTNTDLNNIEEHNIKLSVSNSGRCLDEKIRKVQVYPLVKSIVNATLNSNCAPVEVTYTNASTGGSLSYNWDYDDGESATFGLGDSNHTFSNRTSSRITYNSSLTVTNPIGCTSTVFIPIDVEPEVDASFAMKKLNICTPINTEFTNSTLNGTQFIWDFGDGSPNITRTDKGLISHTFDNTKINDIENFTVQLTATDLTTGCSDFCSAPITIYPILVPNFTVDKSEGCNPMDVTFTNKSTGLGEIIWDFGDLSSSTDINPIHKFLNYTSSDKKFTVNLKTINSEGCFKNITKDITVYPYLLADFTIDNNIGCTPVNVSITNNSRNNISNYWSFGDGRTSTDATPSNIEYQNNNAPSIVDNNEIKLVVLNSHGCKDSTTRDVTIYPRLNPSFNYINEGCHPFNASIINSTIEDDNTSYKWIFSDGSTSYIKTPSKLFINNSIYDDHNFSVKMIATSKYGCIDSLLKNLTVHPKPIADIELPKLMDCAPLMSSVTNNSQGVDLTFYWDFKNGITKETKSTSNIDFTIENTTTQTKQFDIELITESIHGCRDTVINSVFVYPKPIANFNIIGGGCNPVYASFENNSNEVASSFLWNFDDGVSSSKFEPDHRFNSFESNDIIYNVSLKVLSEYNCTDSITKGIEVYAMPLAEFDAESYYKIFPDNIFTFQNNTSQGIWDYVWTFGDENTSYSSNKLTDYKYSTWGPNYLNNIYSVTLEAYNKNHPECNSKITKDIVLKPPVPIVNIIETRTSSCPPFTVTFAAENKWGETHKWNFDDGSYSFEKNPIHTFTEPGVYYVSYESEGDGGKASDYIKVIVHKTPTVNFEVNQNLVMLPDEPVKCYNKSENAEYFIWDFGDGTTSEQKHATHQYTELGFYDIKLKAISAEGCADSLKIVSAVEVSGMGSIVFPNAFLPAGNVSTNSAITINSFNNSIFAPLNKGVKSYNLIIYNRNGELIFQTNDINEGWDGYMNGKLCDQGVYVWKAKGSYYNGKKFELIGDVSLIR
ncbi:MAG: PKD domain-containing protein [Bacteroidales bacterium]|nr:PKD domain-containing protein [Bacteroidales bacterium]